MVNLEFLIKWFHVQYNKTISKQTDVNQLRKKMAIAIIARMH